MCLKKNQYWIMVLKIKIYHYRCQDLCPCVSVEAPGSDCVPRCPAGSAEVDMQVCGSAGHCMSWFPAGMGPAAGLLVVW